MAYDEGLAHRVRVIMEAHPGLDEKKMFGGIGFMLRGNMACGISGDELMVRVGAEGYDQAIQEPHTRPFDMTGRPMKGWLLVAPEGVESDRDLADWVARGVNFTLSLPAK